MSALFGGRCSPTRTRTVGVLNVDGFNVPPHPSAPRGSLDLVQGQGPLLLHQNSPDVPLVVRRRRLVPSLSAPGAGCSRLGFRRTLLDLDLTAADVRFLPCDPAGLKQNKGLKLAPVRSNGSLRVSALGSPVSVCLWPSSGSGPRLQELVPPLGASPG